MLKSAILLAFLAACNECHNVTSTCTQKDVCSSYLDAAMDMISKAKCNIPTCDGNKEKALDCFDLMQMGHKSSGLYEIFVRNRVTGSKPLHVYCDMETVGGGWTVIQRRGNFLRPNDYFFKDWKSYKEGFGDVEKDFWLGNDNIFALTNQKLYSVRFDLKDATQSKRYALYDKFWIDDEIHKYCLHISDYSGNAGDALKISHNNQNFSTYDQDNHQKENCALKYKGGWWYNKCLHYSNLNGLYNQGKLNAFIDGVIWQTWKGHHESLAWTEIKIRPKNSKSSAVTHI